MIPVKSVYQWRLVRFGYTFILAALLWSGFEWNDDGSFNPILVVIPAVLFAFLFTWMDSMSEGYQTEIFIKEKSIDGLVQDLEFLGFRRLRSTKKIYMVWKGQLAVISDGGTYYKVILPKRFELVGEQYRSI